MYIVTLSMCMHVLGIYINSQFCMGDQFWQACLPILVPLGGNIFGKGNHFWLPKLVQETSFYAKISPGDQFLGECVTGFLACDPAMVKCM